ncbi:hypothetical protein PFICI_00243 [Pestalotiopsis fici W106-1]|uniref:NACHT domain-containing protein n=1 Tax=Pestalotiopsis fici (strain W106-1 / CGMCC3.15140) TaxID=1229662 RepID=W3XK89_PESFW|nr:uncharacterized protein PFICI_00243 [Pestalotiopsis fici W106-1]ETS86415.1 hypothetical protein PFICI_00243 [Pestalotiopsis fici W106-1]
MRNKPSYRVMLIRTQVTGGSEQASANTLIPAGIPDPKIATKRIKNHKGKLLKGAYEWILSNNEFKRWRYEDDRRLLWIKGDPGKGKTMLLYGITETLEEEMRARNDQTWVPIYFFIQATDDHLNSAESVMQGLLAFLIQTSQYPRSKYLDSDSTHRANWITLVQKVEEVLRDLDERGVYLIVDALDECVTGLDKLLQVIVELSVSTLKRFKVLVSSRNWTEIEDELSCSEQTIEISLEYYKSSVDHAIGFFIADQVALLVKRKRYSDDLREKVRGYISSNPRNTFLWVALVCKQLAEHKLADSTYATLRSNFPPELNGFYGRMMESIDRSSEDPDLCKQMLAIACTVYRPINWREMKSLLRHPTQNSLGSVIGLCGSFLTTQEDDRMQEDDKIISFVHLSAKDFLLENQGASRQILPHGITHQHYYISEKALKNLSTVLRRDIYGLKEPGYLAKDVSPPDPDPLAPVRYSCVYWPSHVLEFGKPTALDELNTTSLLPFPDRKFLNEAIKDDGIVYRFIQEKYYYWLEALSLLSAIPEGVEAMNRLKSFLV